MKPSCFLTTANSYVLVSVADLDASIEREIKQCTCAWKHCFCDLGYSSAVVYDSIKMVWEKGRERKECAWGFGGRGREGSAHFKCARFHLSAFLNILY